MSTAYEEAVICAEDLMAFTDPEPEALVALGYRAGIEDALAAYYQSMTAEQGNPGQILVVFVNKLNALRVKFEKRAKELRV